MVIKIRVFLADDHPIVRNGLRALVSAQPDMEVVGEAEDGAAAVHGVIETCPDVAVVDVSMPVVSGTKATSEIRARRPGVRVLALSAHEDGAYVQRMLAVGAAGYVIKRTAADDLADAIRRVAAGETFIDPAIAGSVIARLSRRPGASAAADLLSAREADVLKRIARGYPIKEIAADLDLGPRSVETYKVRAMEKLGLRTRADLVRYATDKAWFGDE